MRVFVILFISISCTYAECRKGGIACRQVIYSFEAPFKVLPDIDSISINDTIWLTSAISVQLKDIMTNQVIDYSGAANLGTDLSYLEFTGGSFSDPGAMPAANSFENALIEGIPGKSSYPERTRDFKFVEVNKMYKLRIGIIPKKKGLFSIGPGDAGYVYREKDKCTKASFNLIFRDTDQHLYLYERSRPGYTPSEYEQTHMYCFKVY